MSHVGSNKQVGLKDPRIDNAFDLQVGLNDPRINNAVAGSKIFGFSIAGAPSKAAP